MGIVASTVVPPTLWLLIVVTQRADLGVTQHASDFRVLPFFNRSLARSYLASAHLRVLTDGYNVVSTPFLSAPVNSMALLLAALRSSDSTFGAGRKTASKLDWCHVVFAVVVAIGAPLLLSLPIGRSSQSRVWMPARRTSGWSRPSPLPRLGGPGSVQFVVPARQHREPGGDPGCAWSDPFSSRTSRDRRASPPLGPAWRYLLVAAATASTIALASKSSMCTSSSACCRASASSSVRPRPTAFVGGPDSGNDQCQSFRRCGTVDRIPSSHYGIGLYGMPGIYQRYVVKRRLRRTGRASDDGRPLSAPGRRPVVRDSVPSRPTW